MANLAPPSSQKVGDRPISFLLDSQLGAPPSFVDLVIRPEDLSRVQPSRINVQQTLGGAWADNFGPGLTQITISGHTGWRRTEGDSDDGIARFIKLKESVFDQWHERRKANVAAGLDPDEVRLTFSDGLDEEAYVVAPMNFVLRRSRSRPLLAQYQISMIALDTTGLVSSQMFASTGDSFGMDPTTVQAAGLDSLTASIGDITSKIGSVKTMVDSALVAPVQSFMNQTAQLYGQVRGAIAQVNGIASSLVSVAQMTAQAGINVFRTIAAVASLPQTAKADAMAVAGAYSNIFCVLRNALQQQLYVPDYSTLYGASNCSSTSGGRPMSTLAGENPFYKVVPTAGPAPVSLSQSAQSSLLSMAANDPVLSPMSTASLGSALSSFTSGAVFA